MTALAHHTFAFEDAPIRALIRDDEPWFVGKDVCAALGHTNHNMALGRLDADEKGVSIVYPPHGGSLGGGAQEMTIISEPGVYRLVFTSRTEKAEAFKRWLAHEVLPALRRNGFFSVDDDLLDGEGALLDGHGRWQSSHITERLKFIERTAGPQAALALWRHYKLPDLKRYAIGALAATPQDDPAGCFNHLLRAEGRSLSIREMLDFALRDETGIPALRDHGVYIMKDAVAIADSHNFLRSAFARTQWDGEWKKALIHLDGATRTRKPIIFSKGQSSQAVLVPRETVMNLRHRKALN